jgi:hypothetical protein
MNRNILCTGNCASHCEYRDEQSLEGKTNTWKFSQWRDIYYGGKSVLFFLKLEIFRSGKLDQNEHVPVGRKKRDRRNDEK